MFFLTIGAVMVVMGATMLAFVILLKIIQGVLWVFIKVLEYFVKTSELSSPALVPDQPGDGVIIELHRSEWRVIK